MERKIARNPTMKAPEQYSANHLKLTLISYSNLLCNDALWDCQLSSEGTNREIVQKRREQCKDGIQDLSAKLCHELKKVENERDKLKSTLENCSKELCSLRKKDDEIQQSKCKLNIDFIDYNELKLRTLTLEKDIARNKSEKHEFQTEVDKMMEDLFRFAEKNSFLESENQRLECEVFRMEEQQKQLFEELERMHYTHINQHLEIDCPPVTVIATPVDCSKSMNPAEVVVSGFLSRLRHKQECPNVTKRMKIPVEKLSAKNVETILQLLEMSDYTAAFADNRINGRKLLEMVNDSLETEGMKWIHKEILKKMIQNFQNCGGVPFHMLQTAT